MLFFNTYSDFVFIFILWLARPIGSTVISSLNTTLPPITEWTPCPDDAHFDCASFPVPLDYAHPEVGNATLAIARLKAKKQPRLGTLFTNPGGPGLSGVADLIEGTGVLISTITQGQYDIVSWDPRGVNQSRPQISCGFTSQDSLNQFLGNTVLSGFEARGIFRDQDDLDLFLSKVNETDAKLVETGKRCSESDGEFLKFMGTAAVVRDMVSLSDFLEGTGKQINYWGFSYGTVIGNYFVNMFPDRVGRVIIDGVVDTIIWATQPTFKQVAASLSDTESVLDGLAETCAQAGPLDCSLAQNKATPGAIRQVIKDLINTAYDVHKKGASNITSFGIRKFLEDQFHTPISWDAQLVPQLELWAATLHNATAGNASMLLDTRRSHSEFYTPRQLTNTSNTVDSSVQTFVSELAIACVDGIDQDNVTTRRLFEEVVRVTQQLAPTVGETTFSFGQVYCHRFPVRAVERFTGPFNHNLSYPIIVIGNKVDPITPFSGAQKIAATLGSSARLVKQNGLGHTTKAENSDCIQAVIRDYFLNGRLPENGVVCDTDQSLFPPNNTLISPSPIARR